MSYLPGSRDYFRGIYGNSRAKVILSRLISSGDVWRSFMFSGVDGVGKFMFAERFSMSILCEGKGNEVPCMECPSCVSYKNGVSPFVRVVEPKGGTVSISQIREALEFMMGPSLGPGKVLIIRDANLLSPGASSALLKTMEEVPERSCFILVVPSPYSVLPTIRSRSFVVGFGALTPEEIRNFLKDRGYELSDEELVLLHRMSGGSLNIVLDLLNRNFFSLVEEFYYGIKDKNDAAIKRLFEMEKEEIKLLLDGLLAYMVMKGEIASVEAERIVSSYDLSERGVRPERIAKFLTLGGS